LTFWGDTKICTMLQKAFEEVEANPSVSICIGIYIEALMYTYSVQPFKRPSI
jgi:hypothetical protein